MSEDNAQIGCPEDTMNEEEVVTYRAAIMADFKGTEAYRIINSMLIGLLIEASDKLLDSDTYPDPLLPGIRGQIQAFDTAVKMLDAPEADLRNMNEAIERGRVAAEEAMQNPVSLSPRELYTGGK